MAKRQSFLMYLDWFKNIKKMKQEEKGLLLDLMYAAYNRETLPEIPEDFIVLDVFWDNVDSLIKRNLRDYDKKLDKQSDSPTDSPMTNNRQFTDNKPTTDTATETDPATEPETDPETAKEEVTLQSIKESLAKKGLYHPNMKIPYGYTEEEYIQVLNQ